MFGLFKKAPAAPIAAPKLRRAQLQPRIKHVNFVKALQQAGVPAAQMPTVTPLCGELIVTYAFDLPDSFIMATQGLLAQAGIAEAECGPLASANLARQLPAPQFFARDGCGLAHTGGDMEATLLLTDAVWEEMQPNFRGEILVTVPRRDRILMCDSADAAALGALREQTREFFDERDDAHRLSLQIMARRAGGWTLFDSH